MSNIDLKVTTGVLKTSISKFKKFFSRSGLGDLELTQTSLSFKTSWCNLKIRGLGVKACVVSLLF